MDLERFQHAMSLRNSGQPRAALAELRGMADSIADVGEKSSFLLNEVVCHQMLGEITEARQVWRQARDIQPFDQGLLYIIFYDADLCWYEGKYDEAHEKLEKLWADHAETLRLPIHRNLYELIQNKRGIFLTQCNRFGAAQPVLEEALTFELADIERGDLSFNLGRCYFYLGKMKEAKEQFLTALRVGAQEFYKIQAHYHLGIALCSERAYARALMEFELVEPQAAAAGIERHEICRWLARTCRVLGFKDRADQYEAQAPIDA